MVTISRTSVLRSARSLKFLGRKSRAPYSRALIVAFVPEAVRDENISTGTGSFFIIVFKASSPLTSGISTSRVTTSGRSFSTSSMASRPLEAKPTTSIPFLPSIASESRFLKKNESSTIKTFTLIPQRINHNRMNYTSSQYLLNYSTYTMPVLPGTCCSRTCRRMNAAVPEYL